MNTGVIALVDDDPGMLRALQRLLSGRGFTIRTFTSAEEFLLGCRKLPLDCAVFDLAMPGLDGLDLQDLLRQRQVSLPVIFLTGEGNIPRPFVP
ncbi:MAG: response regulator [Chthoniobacterales bacterium]